MIINLSPIRRDDTLTVERQGDTLILNGEAFDFSPLEDGANLPISAIASGWFAAPVSRVDGQLKVTLIMPHGPYAAGEVRFPKPIIDPPNGPIALPIDTAEEPADV